MRSRRTPVTLAFVFAGSALLALALFWAIAPTAAVPISIQSEPPVIDDFEGGVPVSWFQYGDYDNGTTIAITAETSDTRPGGPSTVLSIAYTSAGWGAGTGHDLPAQDWSDYDGLGFWFYGANTGGIFRVILSDNCSDPNTDTAERFAYEFVDDTAGWRYIAIPWAAFFRDAWQPDGAPNDGLTLTEVWAYALALPSGTSGTVALDDVALLGPGQITLKVGLDSSSYQVAEGGLATITVTLNAPATFPVTVTYATSDGAAAAGADYTAAAGTLVFPAGVTLQTFTVQTLDDGEVEGDETANLTLLDPIDAAMGRAQATLTIVDNDAAPPPPCGRPVVMIDDFEDGQLPAGVDSDGVPVGFLTWSDGSGVAITVTTVADTDPLAVPGQTGDNIVVKLDTNVAAGGWAGFSHAFENETADVWVPQDWSAYEGIALWVYGNATGGTLFVDITDNRNPGSTTDDAERFSYGFPDDFSGWTYVQIPFADFTRKDIGNGAPNDGFGLTEVHGWAFGAYGSVAMGAQTTYVDQVAVLVRTMVIDDFEDGQLPAGVDGDGVPIGFLTWSDGSGVAITVTTVADTDPLALPCQTGDNILCKLDTNVASGGWAGFSHAFENATADAWVPQDWSSYEGIALWVYGNATGGTLFVDIMDNRNPGSTTDDAERFSYGFPDDFSGWKYVQIPFADFTRKDIGNGAPNDGFGLTEVHGWAFGAYGSIAMGAQTTYVDNVLVYGQTAVSQVLQATFAAGQYTVVEGQGAIISVTLNMAAAFPVTVSYSSADSVATPYRDYLPVSGTLVFPPGIQELSFALETLDDAKYEGGERIALHLSDPISATLGFLQRTILLIEDNDVADPAMLDDFEGIYNYQVTGDVGLDIVEIPDSSPLALPGQGAYEQVLSVAYGPADTSRGFARSFAESQDWSGYEGMSFWTYGSNSGETITVQVYDNQATTTAAVNPEEWVLVWKDEFSGPAGTPPDPSKWSMELGDGGLNGIAGWGNGEMEYYTRDPENASTDGLGNLVITARQVDTATTELLCWYGPCEYTSARLLSSQKAEFAYGRIEARLRLPYGQGIWPAWWSLGNDIGTAGWPTCGEMDIMENIGSEPATVYGTIHGPGYSGGAGIGGSYVLPSGALSDEFHVYAIEWTPEQIRWFIDSTNFFTATVADIPAGSEWVYDHPFFLLLNVAVGGNWPGYPDATTIFPQTLHIDYVRVYQAADTAERFEATFVDNFSGWKRITMRFDRLERSALQPADAPDNGLGLTEVWGYGFGLPATGSGAFYLDQVRLESEITPYRLYLPVLVQH